METLNRRDFLRLSTTVAAGAVLASCQPAAPTVAPAAEKPAEQPAEKPAEEKPAASTETVKLILSDWGSAGYAEAWEETKAEFLDSHPGFEVEYQAQPDGWVEKLTAMYVAESPAAPDIFAEWGDIAKRFYETGTLLPLNPYWDTLSADDIADFPTNVVPFWTNNANGDLYAVPKYQGNLVLFVNLDKAAEQGVTDLPTSWADHWTPQEYRDFALQVTKGEVGTPERQYGASRLAWSDRNTPFLNSNGAHFVNPDDDTEDWLYKDEAQECLEFWRVMRQDDHTLPGPTDVAVEVSQTSGRQLFVVQKVISLEDGSWALKEISEGSTHKFDVVPTYSWPAKTTTLATTDGWAVWKGTKNPDAAWELLQFLMSPTFGTAIIKARYLQPMRLSLMDSYTKILRESMPALEDVNLELFKEAREQVLGTPQELHYDEGTFTQMMQPVFQQVYDLGEAGVDLIVQTSAEVTEALRELKAKQEG